MAKKSLAVLVIAILTAGGIFAQDFSVSAGLGGYGGIDFGGGNQREKSGFKEETPYFGGGGYVFFDATYAELSAGVFIGIGKITTTTATAAAESEIDVSYMNLNVSLLGKFPFWITDTLALFPLLGVDYQLCLSAKDKDGNEFKRYDDKVVDAGDYSALWVKAGVGLDIGFTDNLYLRFEALYGARLPTKYETDEKNDKGGQILLDHGPTVKLAVGFRFI
jgi:hypothetical protein